MAANEFHARMSGNDVHGIIRWTVASYADLESLPVLDEDVGKVALVAEDNSLHALVMVTPEGATWRRLDNAAGLMLSSTEPATLDSSSTASAGVAEEAARADHVHALDLPDPILLSDADPLAVSAQEGWSAGTAPEAARADHRHALSTLVAWDVSSLGDVGPDPGDLGKLARVEVDGNIYLYVLARDQPDNLVWLRIDNEELPAQLALSDATPTTLDTLTPASAGTSVDAARADHTHALDLPAPYVLAETTPLPISATAAGAAGTQYVVARADHRHAIDTAAPVAVGAANAPGTSGALARADHVHDASGKADLAWVTTQINGRATIGTGTPASVDPNVAASAGVANTAAPFDHRHAIATAAPVAVGEANAIGTASALARADHVHDASGLRLPAVKWWGWSQESTPTGWEDITTPEWGDVAYVNGEYYIYAPGNAIGTDVQWQQLARIEDVAAKAPLLVPTRTVTTSTATLELSDVGGAVLCDSATQQTITIPSAATVPVPVGAIALIVQLGAGSVVIAAGAGVTLRSSAPTPLQTRAQYAPPAHLWKIAADTWLVSGGLY